MKWNIRPKIDLEQMHKDLELAKTQIKALRTSLDRERTERIREDGRLSTKIKK